MHFVCLTEHTNCVRLWSSPWEDCSTTDRGLFWTEWVANCSSCDAKPSFGELIQTDRNIKQAAASCWCSVFLACTDTTSHWDTRCTAKNWLVLIGSDRPQDKAAKIFTMVFQAERDEFGTALWSHVRVVVVDPSPPPPQG